MTAGEDQPQPIVFAPLHPSAPARIAPRSRLASVDQRVVEPARRRNVSMALKRPAETSQARGLSGTPFSGPRLDRRDEGVVQRFLRKIEVTQQPDQSGEHPARLGTVELLDDRRSY